MKYNYFSGLLIAGLCLFLAGCAHDHSQGGHTHGPSDTGGHSHAHAPSDLSFMVWTKRAELFVQFPSLVVGKMSRQAVHLTAMDNFKPIEKGQIRVALKEGQQKIAENGVPNSSSPGIFPLSITPPKAGTFHLEFILQSPSGLLDTFTIKDVVVYDTKEAATAALPKEPDGDMVNFTKDQAWNIDFAIQQLQRQSINEVIHSSGEIQPVKGEEKIIAAKSSGILLFKSQQLQEGRNVQAGQTLMTISSKGLMQANMEEKFQIAKARIDKTKADFVRAEDLLAQQIIGQKEYELRKMDYSIAEAEFKTLTNGYQSGGQTIKAPMTGLVKNVLVSNGQFVEEGTPLVEITRNRRLLLHADVSQRYLPLLHQLQSANFRTPYHEETQSIDDYKGKLVSLGKMMEEGSNFIPVVFELDNLGALMPGSFVELFLLTKPIKNALVVPRSALMQDYSVNYVYVQMDGEQFEKRIVKLGVDDGVNVQILSGVAEGEWVVTQGAYQIKMASMSNSIPSHGHAH